MLEHASVAGRFNDSAKRNVTWSHRILNSVRRSDLGLVFTSSEKSLIKASPRTINNSTPLLDTRAPVELWLIGCLVLHAASSGYIWYHTVRTQNGLSPCDSIDSISATTVTVRFHYPTHPYCYTVPRLAAITKPSPIFKIFIFLWYIRM